MMRLMERSNWNTQSPLSAIMRVAYKWSAVIENKPRVINAATSEPLHWALSSDGIDNADCFYKLCRTKDKTEKNGLETWLITIMEKTFMLSEKGVPRKIHCDNRLYGYSSQSMCGAISIYPNSKLVTPFDIVFRKGTRIADSKRSFNDFNKTSFEKAKGREF